MCDRAEAAINLIRSFPDPIQSEPNWDSLPAATPHALRRVLKRCLEKSARQRLPHIGAARLELEEALAEARAPVSSAEGGDRAATRRRRNALVAAGLPLAFLLAAAVVYLKWRGGPEPASTGSASPLRLAGVSEGRDRPPEDVRLDR